MDTTHLKTIHTSLGPIELQESGEGRPLLAIHGAMGGYDQSMTFAKTVTRGEYRILAVSRPGYLGTPLSSGISAEEQADLLAALIDELDIEKVDIIAVSAGGPSALHFAKKFKSKCSSLILCSTIGCPTTNKIPLSFSIQTALARVSPLMKFLKKKVEKNIKKVMTRSIRDEKILEATFQDKDTMRLFKTVLVGSFDQISKRIEGTKNDINTGHNFSFPLAEIEVPALVIHGTDDQVAPFDPHGKKLMQTIPDAKTCSVEGGEHVTIFTHRAIVTQEVENFLALTKL